LSALFSPLTARTPCRDVAAYGLPEDIATEDGLVRLLALNLEWAKAQER
jgi:hypothetical protein